MTLCGVLAPTNVVGPAVVALPPIALWLPNLILK